MLTVLLLTLLQLLPGAAEASSPTEQPSGSPSTATAGSAAISTDTSVFIVDDYGCEVRLPSPASRVIALYGAFNEILHSMECTDRIVARTAADHRPEEIASLPSIGTHMRPTIELVAGLKPDLVLQMSGRAAALHSVEALRRHGIPVAVFRASTFPELYRVIRRVGILLGEEESARRLTTSMHERITAVERRVSEHLARGHRPAVFFEVRYPNLLAAGRGSIVNAVIEAAGGRNAVSDSGKLVRLGEEALVGLDPEVYLYQRGPMNPAPIPPQKRPHFRTLRALRSGDVHIVDEQLFSRPGPRNADAVELLADILFPEE